MSNIEYLKESINLKIDIISTIIESIYVHDSETAFELVGQMSDKLQRISFMLETEANLCELEVWLKLFTNRLNEIHMNYVTHTATRQRIFKEFLNGNIRSFQI